MAIILAHGLSITRTTSQDGDKCVIKFYYSITCDDAELTLQLPFNMEVQLMGYDAGTPPIPPNHDLLGSFDHHKFSCGDSGYFVREFEVPCNILDEDWGTDEIFVTVKATSSGAPGGHEYTATGSTSYVASNF